MKSLKTNQALIWSTVVANNAMNRQRQATGINSYHQEIGIDVQAWIGERLKAGKAVHWLDTCCGEGNALHKISLKFEEAIAKQQLRLSGIDLVEFLNPQIDPDKIQLHIADVVEQFPQGPFDLITCVHGLHYLGDKLKFVQQACNALQPDGQFFANLDVINIKGIDRPQLLQALQTTALQFHPKKHLLTYTRTTTDPVMFPFTYQGADDEAGKNYTGKEVVDSYYFSS